MMITDGEVYDVPPGAAPAAAAQLGAPLHVLLSGHPGEGDRRLVVKEAPSFGLVGKTVPLSVRVEDLPERKDVSQGEAKAHLAQGWRRRPYRYRAGRP